MTFEISALYIVKKNWKMSVYPGYQIKEDINDLQDELGRVRAENSFCCPGLIAIFVVVLGFASLIAVFVLC
jgi:hypothetical protein